MAWSWRLSRFESKELARLYLDPFPLLLDWNGIHSGKRYSKFENMWLKTGGLLKRLDRGGHHATFKDPQVTY